MAKLTSRRTTGEARPMSAQATGAWFRRRGTRQVYQRYDEAAPYDGTTHWYLAPGEPWHAFRDADMKPAKEPRKK